MPKPNYIELGDETQLPILYEDRSVIAIDKPLGWMLVPFNWQRTGLNLQAAITSSIASGAFWARSRNVKFLRYVHRLDADTTGILLLAKSPGGVESYGHLFESRRMEKTYLAVVIGTPSKSQWTSQKKIGKDPRQIGSMKIDPVNGKEAETEFKLITRSPNGKLSLVEARPYTGRTHQIRLHLADAGFPIIGDPLYGRPDQPIRPKHIQPLGLRAIFLGYKDPFTKRPVKIRAPHEAFLEQFGFPPLAYSPQPNPPKPSPSS